MNKVLKIFLQAIPVILMLILIPFIKNDYYLTLIFVGITLVSLLIRYEKKDALFFMFGFIVMSLAEYLFLLTGVETFNRVSFLGVMPLWLPFLWAYAFIAIKRTIKILEK